MRHFKSVTGEVIYCEQLRHSKHNAETSLKLTRNNFGESETYQTFFWAMLAETFQITVTKRIIQDKFVILEAAKTMRHIKLVI